MIISVNLCDEDARLVEKCAKLRNMSVPEFVRWAIIEQIEYEADVELYREGVKEYEEDPVTYTYDEVMKMLKEDE